MFKAFKLPQIFVLPIEYANTTSVAKSFKGFFKACLPNDPTRFKPVSKFFSKSSSAGPDEIIPANESQLVVGGNGVDNVDEDNLKITDCCDIWIAAQEHEWFHQLKSLLELSVTVVNLLEEKRTSVAVCLENGCDIVAQVSIYIHINIYIGVCLIRTCFIEFKLVLNYLD